MRVRVEDIELAEIPQEVDEAPDVRTEFEVNLFELERLKYLQQLRRLRETFANRVWRFVRAYSVVALALLLGDGVGLLDLDAAVLSTVVGSTAASAIGLLYLITKSLFPDRDGSGNP